jgi:predicted MFS family arabinose efflux permease
MQRSSLRVAAGGAAVVGTAYGMARYAYGLTLPDVQDEFGLSEPLLALIASGTFLGFLIGLVGAPLLAARRGPRAPTTLGGVCGVVGCGTVAVAPVPVVLAVGAVVAGSAAGWVWAPYSDIVRELVSARDRPTVLAVITTGTGLGLVGLAGLGLLAVAVSWRLTWAGIAVVAALAALLNLRAVPGSVRLARALGSRASPLRRSMVAPLGYAVVYFAAITCYFTYASEAATDETTAAAPLVFALVGVGGLVGTLTGRMTEAVGSGTVGGLSVLVVGGVLVVLGLAPDSLPVVLGSGAVFGVGFMVGSSVLAIWTTEAVPDRPGAGFTVALVVGAVVSVLTPAVAGPVIPAFGLRLVFWIFGALALVGGAAVLAATRRVALARIASRAQPPRAGRSPGHPTRGAGS